MRECGTLRTLKIFVVVMGVLLAVGFAALIVLIAERVSHRRPMAAVEKPFRAPAIAMPRGARVEAMTAGPNRLVLDLALSDGGRRLVILDLATGAELGSVDLRPSP